ncbi:MAG: hypothetical protein U5L09_07880 [Bacteroidales bacterium]|nr:hypothetical protein [Bacteroidales bacterium]
MMLILTVFTTTNYGTVNSTKKVKVKGYFENNGTFSTSEEFKIEENGDVVNYCEIYITDDDFDQKGSFTNYGYVSVDDEIKFEGQTTLGNGSLIEANDFEIKHSSNNFVTGINNSTPPTTQIKATDKGKVKNNASVSNVDLCANETEY